MHTNMRLHCAWMRYWPYNVRFAEPIKGEHLASPLGVPREHPLPLPLGEVAERSECPKGRRTRESILPLPLGEVAERSEDGEGKQ